MIPHTAFDGYTLIFGVIGSPITHTFSPKMHNPVFRKHAINAAYVPFHVNPNQVEDALKGLKALSISGINVTLPHKQTVLKYLDDVDPYAQKVGAVNTIVNKNGRLIGYNTDGPGFILALETECRTTVQNKKCTILGAGGSARAIAFSLAQQHAASLTFINRTLRTAQELAENISSSHPTLPIQCLTNTSSDVATILSDSDIIIQTTSVGLNSTDSPIDNFDWVKPNHICVDIIYLPSKTTFLKQCEQKNAVIQNGLGMLAGQGALAFELFTGIKEDLSTFKRELNHD